MNYLEAKERERLLKKLEPRYHNAELVLLGIMIELDNRYFEPDYYLIVKNAEVEGDRAYHLVITLNPQKPTKNVNALLMGTRASKFSNWWMNSSDLKYMKRYLKPINSFLYSNSQEVKGEL